MFSVLGNLCFALGNPMTPVLQGFQYNSNHKNLYIFFVISIEISKYKWTSQKWHRIEETSETIGIESWASCHNVAPFGPADAGCEYN